MLALYRSGRRADATATHLLERRAGGRFGFHDLLGRYAARLAPADEARRASTRLLEHYLSGVEDAARALYPDKPRLPVTTSGAGFPDEAAASAWLDAERANLVAAVRAAPGREAVVAQPPPCRRGASPADGG